MKTTSSHVQMTHAQLTVSGTHGETGLTVHKIVTLVSEPDTGTSLLQLLVANHVSETLWMLSSVMNLTAQVYCLIVRICFECLGKTVHFYFEYD